MFRQVMTDRRASPRIGMELELHLSRNTGEEVTSRTIDLSVGGASIVSTRPLHTDEEMGFFVDLPGRRRLLGAATVLRHPARDVYALRFAHIGFTDSA